MLLHILRVKELGSETQPIESIPVMREFLEISQDDFPMIPLEWKINIDNDMLVQILFQSLLTGWLLQN